MHPLLLRSTVAFFETNAHHGYDCNPSLLLKSSDVSIKDGNLSVGIEKHSIVMEGTKASLSCLPFAHNQKKIVSWGSAHRWNPIECSIYIRHQGKWSRLI